MDIFENNKKGSGFNILGGDSTSGHGGYGVGVINLDNISPIIVDPEEGEAFVDMGALHARSQVERRIRFKPDKANVEGGGKLYWLVWLNTERGTDGPFYSGAGAADMIINREIRRGYKVLPDHVNKMDKALKGKVEVGHMDDKSKGILRGFLKSHDEGMWERANEELKRQLDE
ncbi:YwhD-like protein [Scopulibacillus darangshiensis]|uniref:YwhD-like protein n=1 Tax=Scopulibacillus darangshiensis TaxID=442528 RepID=A0A4R2NNZ8_9BACL|nr:YwhD family protein [Scopulibacillus darangshiensis]TCP23024.1 YwhD-like protein [Scopulibacillus darangshiensis]